MNKDQVFDCKKTFYLIRNYKKTKRLHQKIIQKSEKISHS